MSVRPTKHGLYVAMLPRPHHARQPAPAKAGDMDHTGKINRRVVSVYKSADFAKDDTAAANSQCRKVVDQLHPKLTDRLDKAESSATAYVACPTAQRAKPHSTDSLERLGDDLKRRSEMFGIFRNGRAMRGRRDAPRTELGMNLRMIVLLEPGIRRQLTGRTHRQRVNHGFLTDPGRAGDQDGSDVDVTTRVGTRTNMCRTLRWNYPMRGNIVLAARHLGGASRKTVQWPLCH